MKAKYRTFDAKAFIVYWIVFGAMGVGIIFLPLVLLARA